MKHQIKTGRVLISKHVCLYQNYNYSATAKLSTKLCETADVTSNLGSDLELLESIE